MKNWKQLLTPFERMTRFFRLACFKNRKRNSRPSLLARSMAWFNGPKMRGRDDR